jgi:sulfatase maturation enzyme AslB (radical SAM superfamily)
MKLAQAQKIFSESFLQQLDNILINGNYGDFVTARDGVAIVEYFKTANPKLNITISTNASAMPHIWQRLGELSVTVKFRLDGLADTHKLYRQNTNWDAIIANAGNFIKAGGTAIWTMIRFDHNKHQIDQCRQLSKQLGFSDFELIDQGRDTMPVFDKDKKTITCDWGL